MPNVTIYQFEIYDGREDQMIRSRRWGTREAIEEIAHGCVIEATAVEVPRHFLHSDIPGLTMIGFNPFRQVAALIDPARALSNAAP